VVIDAAARLRPRYPDVRFVIVGGGPRRTELEALVRERGLETSVRFEGHREDVPALLRQADVFVLPSRSEAFPNGAMEAMAAGLPVVASAVGGLLDLVAHERTGLRLPPGDPEALAEALESLLRAPSRVDVMGTAARREVAERYSFERMVSAFEDMYIGELRRRTGGGRVGRAA
jgi:glycosyltransferase involved in cell wall biosynthesis